MTKQEEIREGIAEFIRQAYIDGYNARCNGELWEQEDGSVKLPEQGILIKTFHLEQQLHSQGVVIKVGRKVADCVNCPVAVVCGYEAVEPLIEKK